MRILPLMNVFRSTFHTAPQPDLSEFVATLNEARSLALQSGTSTVEVDLPDVHMHQLLRTAECLTKKY